MADTKSSTRENGSNSATSKARLLKLKCCFWCIGCGEQHRFTAKRSLTDKKYVVICANYSNADDSSAKVKELIEEEKEHDHRTLCQEERTTTK